MSDSQEKISPLGKKLEELAAAGFVQPMAMPSSQDFPSARVVVPVYNSTGTGSSPFRQGGTVGGLARNS
jgi:hypothetical protein